MPKQKYVSSLACENALLKLSFGNSSLNQSFSLKMTSNTKKFENHSSHSDPHMNLSKRPDILNYHFLLNNLLFPSCLASAVLVCKYQI